MTSQLTFLIFWLGDLNGNTGKLTLYTLCYVEIEEENGDHPWPVSGSTLPKRISFGRDWDVKGLYFSNGVALRDFFFFIISFGVCVNW